MAFGSDRLLGIHYLVWVPAVLLVVLSLVMHATPYGRRIYATGGGREAAYLSGVPVRRVIASTYVWCGALAGVAGVMLAARLQSGQPTAGEFYELTAIAAVVLGGASLQGGEGALYKTVIGVFIMIVLGNALNLLNVDLLLAARGVECRDHCRGRRRKATLDLTGGRVVATGPDFRPAYRFPRRPRHRAFACPSSVFSRPPRSRSCLVARAGRPGARPAEDGDRRLARAG